LAPTIKTGNPHFFKCGVRLGLNYFSLKALVHFAHPYHAWERGLSENTIGLLRQYFPKKLEFRKIEDKSIEHAMTRLNNRPRKTLAFATPNDLFFNDNRNKTTVALVN